MTSVNNIKAGYWLEKQAAAFPVEKIAKTSNYNYLFFGFAALHPSEYTIDLTSEQQIMLTNFVKSCHSNSQNINAILSIGGPGDGGDDNTAAKRFSEMAGSKQNRNKFVNSVIATAVKYRLDGLDLAWEFPTVTADDMSNLGKLLTEVRIAIDTSSKPDLLLSAAVYYMPAIIVGGGELMYPVNAIQSNLDFVNVICYDYCHGQKCLVTCADSRLYDNITFRKVSTNEGISAWTEAGVDKGKLVIGTSVYGKKWQLINQKMRDIGAPANYQGEVSYTDVVLFNHKESARVKHDEKTVIQYSCAKDTWITYDSPKTVFSKVKYAKTYGLLAISSKL